MAKTSKLEIFGAVVFNGREYHDNEILDLLQFTTSELRGWKYAGDIGQRDGDILISYKVGRSEIEHVFAGSKGLPKAIDWLADQEEDSPIFDIVFDKFESFAAPKTARKEKPVAKTAKQAPKKITNVKPKWQKHLDAKMIAEYDKIAKAVDPKFDGYMYWNWLGEDGVENEADYYKFERAAKRLMGERFYTGAESYARCDNLLCAIVEGKVSHEDGITEHMFREWKAEQKKKAAKTAKEAGVRVEIIKPKAPQIAKLKEQLSVAQNRRKASGQNKFSRLEISIMSKICALV